MDRGSGPRERQSFHEILLYQRFQRNRPRAGPDEKDCKRARRRDTSFSEPVREQSFPLRFLPVARNPTRLFRSRLVFTGLRAKWEQLYSEMYGSREES